MPRARAPARPRRGEPAPLNAASQPARPAREGFIVLCPEQEWLANPNRCWNGFEMRSGRATREGGVDHRDHRPGVRAACGRSGACRGRRSVGRREQAALLGARYPARFRAVAMHSGVAPGAARVSDEHCAAAAAGDPGHTRQRRRAGQRTHRRDLVRDRRARARLERRCGQPVLWRRQGTRRHPHDLGVRGARVQSTRLTPGTCSSAPASR